MAAFSLLSLPWEQLRPMLLAKRLRIVPSAALAGLVAPMTSRHLATASSRSRQSRTHGPSLMKSTSSPKKGRSL